MISSEFEKHYRENFQKVVYFFKRKGFDNNESIDLAQEVFLHIYRNIGSFRGEGSLRSWISKIALNYWKNQIRKGQAQKRFGKIIGLEASEEPVSERANPESQTILNDSVSKLKEAMEKLPEQSRSILVLRFFRELTYREIAQKLNISIATVKSRLHRAKSLLAEKVEQSVKIFSQED